MGGHDLQIHEIDDEWPPGTFDFGFEDNLVELIEELIEKTATLDDYSYPINPDEPTSTPPRPTYTPGSPEDIREKRYTPRSGLWCGHETVLRSWNLAGSAKCQDCGLSTRWLWMCTADTPDHSPFVLDPEPIRRDVSILAPWTQQAIARGEYTGAQVEKLLDQKVKVLELAASERRRVAQQREKGPAESSEDMVASLSQATDGQQQLANCDASALDRFITPSPPKRHSHATSCRLLTCADCKPRFFEHAWGGIDAIANEPYIAPPQIPEYLDRPISDASTLRAMHEHCRDWNWTPVFQQWWEKIRFVRGYDLIPMLLMAEMIRSDQADFIELIGQVVLRHRISYGQMCQCLYLIDPQVFVRLAPFFSADAGFMSRCHQPALVVEIGHQPIGGEGESQS